MALANLSLARLSYFFSCRKRCPNHSSDDSRPRPRHRRHPGGYVSASPQSSNRFTVHFQTTNEENPPDCSFTFTFQEDLCIIHHNISPAMMFCQELDLNEPITKCELGALRKILSARIFEHYRAAEFESQSFCDDVLPGVGSKQ
jgi:hypothetical protein